MFTPKYNFRKKKIKMKKQEKSITNKLRNIHFIGKGIRILILYILGCKLTTPLDDNYSLREILEVSILKELPKQIREKQCLIILKKTVTIVDILLSILLPLFGVGLMYWLLHHIVISVISLSEVVLGISIPSWVSAYLLPFLVALLVELLFSQLTRPTD